MEIQINGTMIFNLIVSIAVFFIGMWFKRLESDHREVKEDIRQIKEKYQTKEMANHVNLGVSGQLERIFDKLDSIESKLDKKADK
ncbi:hypothetical protein [Caviibacterium pharyngocola]|uniref:Uncharacterized protein n=1 Tax=Caviibacterium pharyngocola TaxID=28159 RepID=A0A2M8RY17_9PAST|nr:hypothetical protein [Caviibacterium pharyngocola]PJG83781.1 hypothetical protein CVP04_01425 [Caviibacterium pharyngocola]